MKKIILFAFVLTTFASGAFSQTQKYGFVDTEYILSNIPTYAAAQKQLDELAAKWEEEVKNAFTEVENAYKDYQTQKVLLSDEMRKKREDEIN